MLIGLEGMRRLVDLVPEPGQRHHPLPGPSRSGASTCRRRSAEFGERDKINHVHYRNPRGVFPAYVETWIDEGDTDMLAGDARLPGGGLPATLCSDHVPQMTDDLDFGLIGRAYNHGYIKAMIQAANSPS